MKTKSLQINENLHKYLKKYCENEGLILQRLVEKLIINEIGEPPQNRDLSNNKSNK